MSYSLINIVNMFFKGCFDSRVDMHLLISDYISRLSYLGARPSLEPRPLQVFILLFFCTCTENMHIENANNHSARTSVILCKKPLEKTPNIREMRQF